MVNTGLRATVVYHFVWYLWLALCMLKRRVTVGARPLTVSVLCAAGGRCASSDRLCTVCCRRAFITTCQDQLASCLTELRASSEPAAGLLSAQLKASQAALERLRHAPAADSSRLGLGLGMSPARR